MRWCGGTPHSALCTPHSALRTPHPALDTCPTDAVSWALSLLIALLTGGVGLLGAGFVAALIVDWYRISSFEGGSGFFVVFMALFGGLAGTLIGLIAARVSAARPNARFSNIRASRFPASSAPSRSRLSAARPHSTCALRMRR